jgi:hypothetical protein
MIEPDVLERAREAAKRVIEANRSYALGYPTSLWVDAADEAYDIVEAVAPILRGEQ